MTARTEIPRGYPLRHMREAGPCGVLDRVFATRGKPAIIRSDNGREFIAAIVVDWLAERHVPAAFVAKASPQQNCYVERFNGSVRDELRNGELFDTLRTQGGRTLQTRARRPTR